MRFELTTPTLARLCSTTELRPLKDVWTDLHNKQASVETGYMANSLRPRKRLFAVFVIFYRERRESEELTLVCEIFPEYNTHSSGPQEPKKKANYV